MEARFQFFSYAKEKKYKKQFLLIKGEKSVIISIIVEFHTHFRIDIIVTPRSMCSWAKYPERKKDEHQTLQNNYWYGG